MRRRVLKIKISATPKAGVADIFYGYNDYMGYRPLTTILSVWPAALAT